MQLVIYPEQFPSLHAPAHFTLRLERCFDSYLHPEKESEKRSVLPQPGV